MSEKLNEANIKNTNKQICVLKPLFLVRKKAITQELQFIYRDHITIRKYFITF